MSTDEKHGDVSVNTLGVKGESTKINNADDALLAELGYKSEFRRAFSVSFLELMHIESFSNEHPFSISVLRH